MKKKQTSDGLKILYNRFIKDVPGAEEILNQKREKLNIAQKIYDLRTEHNLTQKELANMIGTTTSVISRLEDADYNGHSLNMLKRIADVLECDLKVEFKSIKKIKNDCVKIVYKADRNSTFPLPGQKPTAKKRQLKKAKNNSF